MEIIKEQNKRFLFSGKHNKRLLLIGFVWGKFCVGGNYQRTKQKVSVFRGKILKYTNTGFVVEIKKKQKASQLCFCLLFLLVNTQLPTKRSYFNKTRKSDALNLSNSQRCTKPLKLPLPLLTFLLGWLQGLSVHQPGGLG